MGRREKAANSAAFIITIMLLGILLLAIIYNLSGEVFPLLVVKSGSMEPVLVRGDIIIMERIDPEMVRVGPVDGDVIIFYKPGTKTLIVHRAVGRVENGFITKGDANPGIDYFSPIPPENVVGRWTGIKIPYWTGLGYLSLFLRGEIYPPYGRIVLVLLLLINIIIIVRDILSRVKKDSQGEKRSGS